MDSPPKHDFRKKLSPPPWQTPGSSTLFIANVPYDVKEDEVRALIREVAPQFVSFRMIYGNKKGRHCGYGFCDFGTAEAAAKAKEALLGCKIGKNALHIGPASPPHKPTNEVRRLIKSLHETTDALLEQFSEAKTLGLAELLERLRTVTPAELASASPAVRAQLTALIELLKLEASAVDVSAIQ